MIQGFRAILNQFKRPYIERLEEYTSPETGGPGNEDPLTQDELQHVSRVQEVLDKLDFLYSILEAAIKNGGENTNPDLDARAVSSIFEKNGMFAALRENSALRDELLKCLIIDLKVYPFTLNTKLINAFIQKGVDTHQREYVPNE